MVALTEIDVMFKDILSDVINGCMHQSSDFIKKLARYAVLNEKDIRAWIDPDVKDSPEKSQFLAIYQALNLHMRKSIPEWQKLNFEELEIQAQMIEKTIGSEVTSDI